MECTANVEMPCNCVVSAGWTVQLMLRCHVTVLFLLGGLCSTANVKMPCDCAVSAGWTVQYS